MVDKMEENNGKIRNTTKSPKIPNKLRSLGIQFKNGSVHDFKDVIAIIDETPLGDALGIGFYSFRSKIASPSEFTLAEIIRFAALVNVEEEIIFQFLLKLIKQESKSSREKSNDTKNNETSDKKK